MTNPRHYNKLDEFCINADSVLKTLFGKPETTQRKYPAANIADTPLTTAEQKQAASIMRINHAGEICAQALYQGQGWSARNKNMKQKMHQAAIEEGDHLAWCSKRLQELESHTSYLNPLWYVGSLAIGTTAGLFGDQWSLGFLAETENQVIQHLNKQLNLLPCADKKSYKILQQMKIDEAEHRDEAVKSGAKELPDWIKKCMSLTAKVMVKVSYWI